MFGHEEAWTLDSGQVHGPVMAVWGAGKDGMGSEGVLLSRPGTRLSSLGMMTSLSMATWASLILSVLLELPPTAGVKAGVLLGVLVVCMVHRSRRRWWSGLSSVARGGWWMGDGRWLGGK